MLFCCVYKIYDVYLCILKKEKMTIQELKDNRNEIINIITDKNIYNTPLSMLMKKFAEYAQLGCVGDYDIEEVEEIADEVINELKGYQSSIERTKHQTIVEEIKRKSLLGQRGLL